MELTTVPLWHYLLHKWDSNPQPSPFRRRCSIPFKLPCTTTCTSLSFCYPNRTRTCDLFHVKEVLLSQLSYRAICVVLTGFEPMFTLRPPGCKPVALNQLSYRTILIYVPQVGFEPTMFTTRVMVSKTMVFQLFTTEAFLIHFLIALSLTPYFLPTAQHCTPKWNRTIASCM